MYNTYIYIHIPCAIYLKTFITWQTQFQDTKFMSPPPPKVWQQEHNKYFAPCCFWREVAFADYLVRLFARLSVIALSSLNAIRYKEHFFKSIYLLSIKHFIWFLQFLVRTLTITSFFSFNLKGQPSFLVNCVNGIFMSMKEW